MRAKKAAARRARSTSERHRSLLVVNGIGLLISALISGWLHFFQLLGEIDLWPFVRHVQFAVPGEDRAWVMAHLEGITSGLLLIALAPGSRYLRLSPRQFGILFWCALAFGWLFTLPAIAWFGTRGLVFGGGPWGPSLANDIIFRLGWPAMVGVHIAFALLAWGAWQHYRNIDRS